MPWVGVALAAVGMAYAAWFAWHMVGAAVEVARDEYRRRRAFVRGDRRAP